MQDNVSDNFRDIRNIDIWWGGLKGNGGLMMIIGYLLKRSPRLQHVKITIKMAVPTEEAAIGANKNLKKILSEMRVDFQSQVLVLNKENFWDMLKSESANSDLVMLGLKTPDDEFNNYYNKLKTDTKEIPRKMFVLAAQTIEFKDVLS